MDEKSFSALIINLERDLRELKQAHRVSSLLKAQVFTEETEEETHIIRDGIFQVTYAEGSQPILSEFYLNLGVATLIPETPQGNTQLFYCDYYIKGYLTIVSTRKIISVKQFGT